MQPLISPIIREVLQYMVNILKGITSVAVTFFRHHGEYGDVSL